MVSVSQLQQIFPQGDANDLAEICEPLNAAMAEFNIANPQEQAMFLAQCGHESGNFSTVQENLNYRAETLVKVFPKYFRDVNPADYEKQPEKIANRVYSNRMGNGDEASGDGWKFCGRGLIQVTGRNNYQAFADSLQMSIDDVPEFLTTFEGAVQSACWFWENNNLNQYADAGNIKELSIKINGGTLGLDERIQHCTRAYQILSA